MQLTGNFPMLAHLDILLNATEISTKAALTGTRDEEFVNVIIIKIFTGLCRALVAVVVCAVYFETGRVSEGTDPARRKTGFVRVLARIEMREYAAVECIPFMHVRSHC